MTDQKVYYGFAKHGKVWIVENPRIKGEQTCYIVHSTLNQFTGDDAYWTHRLDKALTEFDVTMSILNDDEAWNDLVNHSGRLANV